MRQKNTSGYTLIAGPPVGRTIYPGEEFDAGQPVTGCEPVGEDGGEQDGGAPPDEPGKAGDKPAAKGRTSGKESRP